MGDVMQRGELAYWLNVVVENGEPGAPQIPVPEQFVTALTTLRCIERNAQGQLVVTEKGRLALHMEEPGALHRQ
ncbi:hypothetical protein [Bordetella pertussis]|uniref:Uncharacterized protein n=2 Tax=Bordetella pertussis TaxID=520 RepID=Q7VZL0_BORPE|nr:hypothetical protein [Bordetella pertussis]AEE66317.1 hypothetical protein BPTD_0888 [Bordetella pertussis CS]AIW93193.1 hypothetical protein B1917_2932 [Bordetella pertussis B1917]AIW94881.1 hypothetical protein B1920_0915 [Bordetella pertussis B1920]AJB25624.1 hypothetical protein Q425_8270 [Bordetella pertussis 137]ALH50244.1 hypothetical protein B1838_2935 [Bordetella pertussis]